SKKNKGLRRELFHLARENVLGDTDSPHQITRSNLKARNSLVSELAMAESCQSRPEPEMMSIITTQERRFDQKFQEMMESMQQMFAAVNTRLDNVSGYREQGEHSSQTPPCSDRNHDTLVALVLVLLTPKEERVPLASWNLEGDAQLWYQLLKEKRGEHCITWQVFKDELFERFGPTRYQDFFGDLTKLQQSGTVKEYHTQFSILLLRAETKAAILAISLAIERNARFEIFEGDAQLIVDWMPWRFNPFLELQSFNLRRQKCSSQLHLLDSCKDS
ncbi:hypothetical protein RJ639_010095, partial [Escallonia herrerae]